MSQRAEFILLGTGASSGVPVVGCDCEVCRSHNPKNQRFRPSGLLRARGKTVMVDTGPDFRSQALRGEVHHIDGVIYTHTHYDHVGGLDDLRIFFFRQKQPIPCLLSHESLEDLKTRFNYIFRPRTHSKNFTVQMEFQVLEQREGEVVFCGLPTTYFSYQQGGMWVNGFRWGNLAYVSDICDYEDSIFQWLFGVKYLVVSALRHGPSHVHLTVDQAVDFSRRVGAQRTWFTHISHELDHEETNAILPPEVRMGYDGLIIDFDF